jgi:hypothetical protein
VSFSAKEILILEYPYLDFLKLACPWSLFLSRVSLVEYSCTQGLLNPLLQVRFMNKSTLNLVA